MAAKTSQQRQWWRGMRLLGALTVRAATGWINDRAMRLAASLSFFSMLSIGPLLVITLKVVGLLLGEEAAEGHLYRYMEQMVGPRGALVIEEMVIEAGQNDTGVLATVVSVGIVIFSASYVFAELQDAMNTVWKVPAPEGKAAIWHVVRTRLVSLALVLSLAFLLLVSLIISTALAAITAFFLPEPGVAGHVIDFFVSLAVISGIFAVLFKYIPDVKLRWNDVWLGALLTAVLFTIGQTLLALYLGQAVALNIYGAAGSLVALLLWVYYSAQIVFFGAEFTKSYVHWRKGRPPVETEGF